MLCALTRARVMFQGVDGGGGWRGDLSIIPKLLCYCGQIKVVFMLGLWICVCHAAVEKDTQM